MHFDFSSIESTVVYIKSFGVNGPLVAFILFFIQAVAPIIPYIILAGAAGMIYGNLVGFILAWSGALAGACFVYWITRKLRNTWLIKKIQDKYNIDIKNVDENKIFWILLISRIFPLVPTPIINVGAGLGGVSARTFISSSAIGKMPWAIIYVALGNYLMQSKNLINTIVIIGLIFVVSVVGIQYFKKRIPTFIKSNE